MTKNCLFKFLTHYMCVSSFIWVEVLYVCFQPSYIQYTVNSLNNSEVGVHSSERLIEKSPYKSNVL